VLLFIGADVVGVEVGRLDSELSFLLRSPGLLSLLLSFRGLPVDEDRDDEVGPGTFNGTQSKDFFFGVPFIAGTPLATGGTVVVSGAAGAAAASARLDEEGLLFGATSGCLIACSNVGQDTGSARLC